MCKAEHITSAAGRTVRHQCMQPHTPIEWYYIYAWTRKNLKSFGTDISGLLTGTLSTYNAKLYQRKNAHKCMVNDK